MKTLFIVVNIDRFLLSHRQEIAVAAKEAGYDVTVVAKDTGKRKSIEALGVKYMDLPMNRSGQNIIEELGTCKFLYHLYKKEKPDVIHHVGLKAILWGTLAAKLAGAHGVANAVSGLGIFFSEDNQSFAAKLMPKVLKYAHKQKNIAVIFQNDEDKGLFLKHGIINEKQAWFIKGSGVDLNQFNYAPEPCDGKIKVLLTARMITEKGIFILTEAAEILRKEFEDKVEFLLCGGLDDNPKALKIEQLEAACDGKYIKWLGYRTDVLELLKQCHIVAFPSYYREGLPKSLIEANAVGRPIITTDSVGCRETVIDGYNGFLIPIKNSGMLAEKLKTLIDNKPLRQEMGRNARKYAEKHFSIEDVVKKHLDIYEELAHNLT